MNVLNSKYSFLSVALIVLGMLMLIAENNFYQYVDSEGVLHESLFLPLGIISIALGGIFLCFIIIQRVWCSLAKA